MKPVFRLLARLRLSISASMFTALVLSFVYCKVETPVLLAGRFMRGLGWLEIILVSIYAGYITDKMKDPGQSTRWRRIAWNVFAIVFFTQLILGILGYERFLMTGELHLPVPLMILSGPIFRGSISFMPVLFISTLIIAGPAWCSQLCYFGALDNTMASSRTKSKPLAGKFRIKHTLLMSVISLTLILRFLDVSTRWTTIIAGAFGITGLAIIAFISPGKGKMAQCILWCPIGTLVNYLKWISPFRMYIDQSCTDCMACTRYCNYDALNREDILKRKPGLTCTLCGDCISSCRFESIRYKFMNFSPENARNTWIVLTVSLHAVFLAFARI